MKPHDGPHSGVTDTAPLRLRAQGGDQSQAGIGSAAAVVVTGMGLVGPKLQTAAIFLRSLAP